MRRTKKAPSGERSNTGWKRGDAEFAIDRNIVVAQDMHQVVPDCQVFSTKSAVLPGLTLPPFDDFKNTTNLLS